MGTVVVTREPLLFQAPDESLSQWLLWGTAGLLHTVPSLTEHWAGLALRWKPWDLSFCL